MLQQGWEGHPALPGGCLSPPLQGSTWKHQGDGMRRGSHCYGAVPSLARWAGKGKTSSGGSSHVTGDFRKRAPFIKFLKCAAQMVWSANAL